MRKSIETDLPQTQVECSASDVTKSSSEKSGTISAVFAFTRYKKRDALRSPTQNSNAKESGSDILHVVSVHHRIDHDRVVGMGICSDRNFGWIPDRRWIMTNWLEVIIPLIVAALLSWWGWRGINRMIRNDMPRGKP